MASELDRECKALAEGMAEKHRAHMVVVAIAPDGACTISFNEHMTNSDVKRILEYVARSLPADPPANVPQ